VAYHLRICWPFDDILKGGEIMKRFAIALAVVLGLNLFGSMLNLSAPVSYAQETPEPEKPDKPKD